MNDYCPDCGSELSEPRDLRKYWLRLLKCVDKGCGFFLEVGDSRWVYPMQRLDLGVGDKMIAVDEDVIENAVGRIEAINYKTVSILEFERLIKESGKS